MSPIFFVTLLNRAGIEQIPAYSSYESSIEFSERMCTSLCILQVRSIQNKETWNKLVMVSLIDTMTFDFGAYLRII